MMKGDHLLLYLLKNVAILLQCTPTYVLHVHNYVYVNTCISVYIYWSVGVHVAGMVVVIPNMIESGDGGGYDSVETT